MEQCLAGVDQCRTLAGATGDERQNWLTQNWLTQNWLTLAPRQPSVFASETGDAIGKGPIRRGDTTL